MEAYNFLSVNELNSTSFPYILNLLTPLAMTKDLCVSAI